MWIYPSWSQIHHPKMTKKKNTSSHPKSARRSGRKNTREFICKNKTHDPKSQKSLEITQQKPTNKNKTHFIWSLPSSKLTWPWKSTFSCRKYIFKWWISHCYLSLPEGKTFPSEKKFRAKTPAFTRWKGPAVWRTKSHGFTDKARLMEPLSCQKGN